MAFACTESLQWTVIVVMSGCLAADGVNGSGSRQRRAHGFPSTDEHMNTKKVPALVQIGVHACIQSCASIGGSLELVLHPTVNAKFHTPYTLVFMLPSPSDIVDEYLPPLLPAFVCMVGFMEYGLID
jgi:hypothetical protein